MGNGQTVALDASAVLAMLLSEPSAAWVADEIDAAARLVMGAVTVTEVMIRLLARLPEAAARFEATLQSYGVEIIPVDTRHAMIAAEARLRLPLNLGDCFVYALAKAENASILTLDTDFRNCGLPVLMPA